MRVAIVGLGGIGCLLATHLVRGGCTVVAVARGATLDAVRNTGIALELDGAEIVTPLDVTDTPRSIGPIDLAIVCVKMFDLEAAMATLAPALGPATAVLPIQNGVDGPDIVARAFGPSRTLIGTAYTFAKAVRPGRVRQLGRTPRFFVGEHRGRASARTEAFRAALNAAGLIAPAVDDARPELWRKFAFLTAMAGVTAASGRPVGDVRREAPARELFVAAIEEVQSVAAARGIPLPADVVSSSLAIIDNAPPEATSSLAADLAGARRNENDWLSGAVVRIGRELRVATPIHLAFHALISLAGQTAGVASRPSKS
ncbi:MAG: ketopantoate reductase family protein [Bauldia sp.]